MRAAAALVVVFILGGIGRAAAGPIGPFSVQPLGAFASQPGAIYQLHGGMAGPTLTSLYGPSVSYTGTYVQDAPGNTVAVFDFTSFTLAPGALILASGGLLAILSQGDLTVGGVIDDSARLFPMGGTGAGETNASPGTAETYYNHGSSVFLTSGGGGGGFGGAGGPGSPVIPGPFGGPFLLGGAGGPATADDLAVRLVGGTAGAASGYSLGESGYGGGGGIELAAAGALTLQATGAILANGAGAPGPIYSYAGSGGGSGGGVFLFGGTVSVQGPISATGGRGDPGGIYAHEYYSAGGEGGGGRVLIEGYNSAPVVGPGLIDVSGYTPGAITIASVPEPSSLVLMGTGLAALAGLAWRGGGWPDALQARCTTVPHLDEAIREGTFPPRWGAERSRSHHIRALPDRVPRQCSSGIDLAP